jgi:hypothetical protein
MKILLVAAACVALNPTVSASADATSGTVPLLLDGDRIYAELTFVRPNGVRHSVWAFVDLGGPSMLVSEELLQELKVDSQHPATLQVGDLPVRLDTGTLSSDAWLPHFVGNHRKVEALLPAAVLQRYQVVIDYGHRTLTLAQPGTLRLVGTRVPIEINPATGLAAINITVDGRRYAVALDSGSAYTWLRQSAVREWLADHPAWQRGVGAVGPSNMRMEDDGIEAAGMLIRIPEIAVGHLRLQNVGILAIGQRQNDNWDFMDWYSQKTPQPVIGWLGGNILQGFRISIDYERHMTYWRPQRPLNGHDLNQVGVTLAKKHGEYFVTAVAAHEGKPTVEGIQVGDKLLQIGALPAQGASSSAVLAALSGRPGDRRLLVLERDHKSLIVEARVTEF